MPFVVLSGPINVVGSLLYGPLKILREYDVADCSHSKPINAAECLKRVAFKERHRKKYFVATKVRHFSLRETDGEFAGIRWN